MDDDLESTKVVGELRPARHVERVLIGEGRRKQIKAFAKHPAHESVGACDESAPSCGGRSVAAGKGLTRAGNS